MADIGQKFSLGLAGRLGHFFGSSNFFLNTATLGDVLEGPPNHPGFALGAFTLPNHFTKHMHPNQVALVGAQLQFHVHITAGAGSVIQRFGKLRSGFLGIKCNRFFQRRLMREVCFNNVVNLFPLFFKKYEILR